MMGVEELVVMDMVVELITAGLLQVLELVDDSLWMPNLDWAAVLMGAERRVCGGFAGLV
jgi:hypothetical protein